MVAGCDNRHGMRRNSTFSDAPPAFGKQEAPAVEAEVPAAQVGRGASVIERAGRSASAAVREAGSSLQPRSMAAYAGPSVDDALRALVGHELERIIRDELPRIVRQELAALVKVQPRDASESGASLQLISSTRAAQIAGVKAATVQAWVRQGHLKGYWAGRRLRVRLDELESFLSRGKVGAPERVDLDERANRILAKRQRRLTPEGK